MIAWGNIDGIITVILMVLFIGIWIWAWRKKHRKVFDRMAALPMEDDLDQVTTDKDTKGTDHD